MIDDLLHRFLRLKYQIAFGVLLVAASILCIILYGVHIYYNEGAAYPSLAFNLFLAWIPFVAAALAYVVRPVRPLFYLLAPICMVIWLIFFPNAPYLLTDFQHLSYSDSNVPMWFDVILFIWFAWTGLLLGIGSLYLMQEIVARMFSGWVSWIFAIVSTMLSSIGIYLGRFLRWNSWDLLYDPIPIARDMATIVRNPLANLPTYVFTILFTLLFLFIYIAIHLFAGMIRERRERELA